MCTSGCMIIGVYLFLLCVLLVLWSLMCIYSYCKYFWLYDRQPGMDSGCQCWKWYIFIQSCFFLYIFCVGFFLDFFTDFTVFHSFIKSYLYLFFCRCEPVYCQYQFLKLPTHISGGKEHEQNIYWDDKNVVLLGWYTCALSAY